MTYKPSMLLWEVLNINVYLEKKTSTYFKEKYLWYKTNDSY